jgi:hypothetical protein
MLLRFDLTLPSFDSFERDIRGRRRGDKEQNVAHQQAIRQRYRALALIIRAKLEAIESGVVDFQSEFLPQTVIPERDITVAEHLKESGLILRLAAAPGNEPQILAPAGRMEAVA